METVENLTILWSGWMNLTFYLGKIEMEIPLFEAPFNYSYGRLSYLNNLKTRFECCTEKHPI